MENPYCSCKARQLQSLWRIPTAAVGVQGVALQRAGTMVVSSCRSASFRNHLRLATHRSPHLAAYRSVLGDGKRAAAGLRGELCGGQRTNSLPPPSASPLLSTPRTSSTQAAALSENLPTTVGVGEQEETLGVGCRTRSSLVWHELSVNRLVGSCLCRHSCCAANTHRDLQPPGAGAL